MTGFSKYLNWSLILIVPWIITCSPNVTLADDQASANQALAKKLELQLEDKRLTANIRNVPLRDVAKALETKANVHILVNDPEIGDEPVSVRVHPSSLEEAMKAILNGFSYALSSSPQGVAAVVLSTPPQRYGGSESLESTCQNNFADSPTSTPEAHPASPQNQDGFRSLSPNTGECVALITADSDSSGSLSPEDGDQEQEAVLRRALDILNSPQRHLYADAIEQLGMLQDELANATLIKFAQQSEEGPERYLATEALARIAVQSEFKDAYVIQVLEQLASDNNEDVRRSASQVIEQMHQVELASR